MVADADRHDVENGHVVVGEELGAHMDVLAVVALEPGAQQHALPGGAEVLLVQRHELLARRARVVQLLEFPAERVGILFSSVHLVVAQVEVHPGVELLNLSHDRAPMVEFH